MNPLFNALVHHTHAVVRRDEAYIACPECGKESSPMNVHFSFSPRGAFCFSCGYKAGLRSMARKVGLVDDRPYTAPAHRSEPERKPASWLPSAPSLVDHYRANPGAWQAWQAYKPVSRGDFERCRLGLGVLPASKCRHDRLIVPIYSGTEIRGLRGRAIDCACGKWLAPGGTNIGLYPLYNEPALNSGCIVWIVENPVDALLLTERTAYVGVATYSVAYWYDAWTEALRSARPELVVIAYDQDLPGNGGAGRRDEFIRDWLRSHPRVPEPAGPRLTNRLRAAGLPAVLYDWGRAPVKTDIGSLLMGAA